MPLPSCTFDELSAEIVDDRALAIMEEWGRTFDPLAPPRRIDRGLVHAATEENVLIARHTRVGDGVTLSEVTSDWRHPFFFDHEQDHVPGLYLMECVRQICLASSHAFYGIPLGVKLVMTELATEFRVFGELDRALFIVHRNYGGAYTGERATSLKAAACIVQDGRALGLIRYDGVALERADYDALRGPAVEHSRSLSGPLGSQALSAAVAS